MQEIPQPESIQTKAQVAKVIEDLRKSERAKTLCGKRLINYYDAHKND